MRCKWSTSALLNKINAVNYWGKFVVFENELNFDMAAENIVSNDFNDLLLDLFMFHKLFNPSNSSVTTDMKSRLCTAFSTSSKRTSDLSYSFVISTHWSAACPYNWDFSTITCSRPCTLFELLYGSKSLNYFQSSTATLYLSQSWRWTCIPSESGAW